MNRYERIRVSVLEWTDTTSKEICFAYGYGVEEAVEEARDMDRKSRNGGGR